MACCKCGHIRDVAGLELGEWSAKWLGREVSIPPVEHAALKLLTAEPGKLIHWTMLGSYANARLVISRLRAVFYTVDPDFDLIRTARGRGGWRWAI